MSQNSGPFLSSSYGHPSFNPRLPSSSSSLSPSLKRPGNSPMSIGNLPNTSLGPNMNVSPSPTMMRPSNSMGPLKPGTVGMNPMDKSNSMPYSSRYTRKAWPITRSFQDKNIRGHDDHESPYLRPGLPSHGVPSDSMSGSSFTIEPATDDDEMEDIYFSTRHMAGARFQRNQRLIAEIFNDVCIPDLRSNVNVDRILQLRRQVDALKTHRDTFDKDLNELEEKHAEKKRKFIEANEKFHSEYVEASATNLTQEKINEILQKYEAMEKLQKEKQLLLQQQQQQQQQSAATVAVPPLTLQSQTSSSTTTTTTVAAAAATTAVVSEPAVPPVMRTEPEPHVEVPQQPISTPPPPPAPAQIPPTQTVTAPVVPPAQSVASPLPSSQPPPTQIPPTQAVHSQMPSSHPVQTQQLPTSMPPPPVMQQIPLQPQQQPPQMAPTSQGYPVMHSSSGYAQTAGYGHPQQTQYRSAMSQRPVQYPSNVQWQQQQQPQQQPQQQWQTNAYDPRYYNQYPSNVQWSQQPQQWSSNQSQQQMGVVSHPQQPPMRGPPQQQQPAMYGSNVHYGYGGTPAGWNPGAHPSQSYGYPQNPSYDPSLVSTPPQQQYYSQPQMHNPPQGYEYVPSSQQQPPPPPQMN